ncbi:6573_t:CDS:1, partial [Dentiscutata heterogama]
MLNVNGEKRRPLGEVENLPVKIGEYSLSINVVVADTDIYSVIVGNDWLSKAKAKINWEKSVMKIKNKDIKIQVPIDFRHITGIPRVKHIPKEIQNKESSDKSDYESS